MKDITDLLGSRYPVIQGAMGVICNPEMVAAVSEAGGYGLLSTGTLHAEQTRQSIKEIRELPDEPFGANATLLFPGAYENAKIILEEQVTVVNFAVSKGD